MTIATIKRAERYFKVNADTPNLSGFPLIEIGPGGTNKLTSCVAIQFDPDNAWDGNFVVMGRMTGVFADGADMPWVPVPYRRVTLADVASDYAMVSAAITGQALILVPSTGLTIALQCTYVAGTMEIASWDLQGSSMM